MSLNGPEQFELDTLETFIRSVESENKSSSSLYCSIFIGTGIILLLAVYFLHGQNLFSAYWLYFMTVLSGVTISGGAMIKKLTKQSELLQKYVDAEAISQRISELKKIN